MKMSDDTSSTVTLPMFSFPFTLLYLLLSLGCATKRFVGVTYTRNRADVLTLGLWDTYFHVGDVLTLELWDTYFHVCDVLTLGLWDTYFHVCDVLTLGLWDTHFHACDVLTLGL